jgi:hypothetical protein
MRVTSTSSIESGQAHGMNLWKLTVGVVSRGASSGGCPDPIVANGLVRVEDGRHTLRYTGSLRGRWIRSHHVHTGVNIDILDCDRIVLDTIGLDESDIVVIDGEGEEGAAGNSKDAKPISLSFNDVYDGKGN